MATVTRINNATLASTTHAQVNARNVTTRDRVPIHTISLFTFLSILIRNMDIR